VGSYGSYVIEGVSRPRTGLLLASRANRSTFRTYEKIETHRADFCTPDAVRDCCQCHAFDIASDCSRRHRYGGCQRPCRLLDSLLGYRRIVWKLLYSTGRTPCDVRNLRHESEW
jgi:hypothetical protein